MWVRYGVVHDGVASRIVPPVWMPSRSEQIAGRHLADVIHRPVQGKTTIAKIASSQPNRASTASPWVTLPDRCVFSRRCRWDCRSLIRISPSVVDAAPPPVDHRVLYLIGHEGGGQIILP